MFRIWLRFYLKFNVSEVIQIFKKNENLWKPLKENISRLPEEDRQMSCGMLYCSTDKLKMVQTDEDSSSRCICSGKRKGQEEMSNQEAKCSKNSPTPQANPVFSFMQKWTQVPLTSENLINETLKEQVRYKYNSFWNMHPPPSQDQYI